MSSHWSGDLESKPAPGPLRLIQALINTFDRESGQDRLADPVDAAPWMTANGLLSDGATITGSDLQAVVRVREALRALVQHTSGGPEPEEAELASLRGVVEAGRAVATLSRGGHVTLVAEGESVPARLFTLLLIVKDAQDDGTWAHLKTCANQECRWAFYDRSRNHGGTWCEMSSCGNKLKNREFRARRKS